MSAGTHNTQKLTVWYAILKSSKFKRRFKNKKGEQILMTHITRKKEVRNADGTFKTLDQIMRAQMTVLQYGQYLAAAKAPA
jgi:hypothetical protein